jgi:hypothetical protein
MPIELQIIRASDFVRLKPDRLLDFAETSKALGLLARACRKRGMTRALLDLRGLPVPEKPLFKPQQLAALVDSFAEAGFQASDRLAVLYATDRWHGVRTFAFIAKLKGCQIRALQDFEEAMEWLAEEVDEEPTRALAVKVRVVKEKTAPGLIPRLPEEKTGARRLRT